MRSFLAEVTALAALFVGNPILAQPPKSSETPKSSQKADLIVINAKVHTVDAQKPKATAFAVRDGKFIAVGTDAEMEPLRQ